MASKSTNPPPPSSSSSSSSSLYPQVITSNPEAPSPNHLPYPTSSLYPSVDMTRVAENLFPDDSDVPAALPTSLPVEDVLIALPGAIVHLIDQQRSVQLACGELTIVRLCQDHNVVAVLARIGDEIQWPLAKDEAVVKLDDSHYFFTLRLPAPGDDNADDQLNYGLTIASKGQTAKLKELDGILEKYSSFSVQQVKGAGNWEVLGGYIASPEEMMRDENKKELLEKNSMAYWTTLAPNVEDYSGLVARMIAAGSGQLIKGILWCGDVTVDRLKWGNEFMMKRMGPGSSSEISPQALKRMKRVKTLTKMTEKMANGVLCGVVKVSGFFTSSVVNSKVGKKFFSLLPGEIILASLDGFNKVCDAVEVAGRNVMATTSFVTTGLVTQKYGEDAGKATNEGLDAAGHAFGTAWAVFKIRKTFNPKSVFKPTTLVKAAAESSQSKPKTKEK